MWRGWRYRRLTLTLWMSSTTVATPISSVSSAAFLCSAHAASRRSAAAAALFLRPVALGGSATRRTRSSWFASSSIASLRRTSQQQPPLNPCSSASSYTVPNTFTSTMAASSSSSTDDPTETEMDAPASSSSSSSVFRVALCQLRVTADKTINLQTAEQFLRQAKSNGAELAVLPEIWNSPYATAAFPDYAEELPQVGDVEIRSSSSVSAQLLCSMAQELNLWVVGGSVPEQEQGKYYNTCLVFNPQGQVVAKHRKVHLFDIDVPGKLTFRESDTLSAGNTFTTFDTPWCTIGVGICYDIRFPEYASILTHHKHCRVLIYPGAFNLTTGPLHWELLQRARAVDGQCWVLTASPARNKPVVVSGEEGSSSSSSSSSPSSSTTHKYPPYVAWGHSSAVSPWGEVVATTNENESVVMVNVDLTLVEDMRKSIPTFDQKRHDLYTVQENGVK